MAKRKRLSPAVLTPETVSDGPLETVSARPPIAKVAGDAAEQAGLAEVARALTEAREEGRLIQKLPLDAIETGHLVRDRIAFDEAEMAVLADSLAKRGQQVPVEVVALDDGRYGLISGLRRVMALGRIGAEEVLAIIRAPAGSAEAYLAMVEENEIRAGISFYERARLAAEAARLGIHPSPAAAIAALFSSASPAKRSKIGSFVRIHDAFGAALRFPAAIPERLGLALAAALEEEAGFAARISAALAEAAPESAPEERALLERALKGQGGKAAQAPVQDAIPVADGVALQIRKQRLVLSGTGVDDDLRRDLMAWLAARQGR